MSFNHALRRSASQLLARAAAANTASELPTMAMGSVRNLSSRSAGDLVLGPFRGCSPRYRSLAPFFQPSSLGSLSRAMDELLQMDRHLTAELAHVFGDSPLARNSPLFSDSPFRSAISKSVSVSRPTQFRAFEDRYELQADMPGVAESDLHIELDAEEGLLTISGARRDGASPPIPQAPATAAAGGPAGTASAAEADAAAGTQQQPASAPGTAAAGVEAGSNGNNCAVWTFRGSWQLPGDVEADGVAAALERGVLRVTLPRRQAPEKPQPRRIKVTAGAQ